ncbi:MAG TPA: OpgC domain-containing protein [Roseiarcus sp.]|nr:OpgC domain-containing protein [Roseiarcus sp.]
MKSNRIRDIDFWRGAVLIAILIDHIPGNPLENWTPRNFGLSDSAEAFVFLSGLSVGLIYLPRASKYGLEPVAGGCLKRALKLYGVHIALTLAALAVFGAAYWASGAPDLIQAHGRAFVFGSPANGLLGLALLSHQLGYFNILPLYVVLMLWAPVALALALRGPLLALAVSIGLYGAARAFGLNLPNWPGPGGWFFNPIAWQLIFTLGLVSAILWRDGLPRPAAWLVTLSVATVAGAALIVTDEVGFAPGLRDTATAHLDVAKQDLGLARLVHFLALAYLIAMATTALRRFIAPVVRGAFGTAVQSLGRNSLPVFAAGSVLSAGGQAALAVTSTHASAGIEQFVGLAYTVASIAALFAVAHRIECRNARLSAASPVAQPAPWRSWRGVPASSSP